MFLQAGLTALHLAARRGHCCVLSELLDHSATCLACDLGATSLHLAAEHGQTEAVAVLLERRMDIEATEEAGATALYLASENGHLSTVQLLVVHLACK